MTAEKRLEKKLAELGISLPPAPKPKGVYRPLILMGNLATTAGHLPVQPDGNLVKGRLGDDLDVEAGYRAAQLVGLGILATLRTQLGSLDRVRRVIRVFGVVNSTADFTAQPSVVNGCSELLVDIFGDQAGVGVRSAIGTNTLPLGVPVEIEAAFEVI